MARHVWRLYSGSWPTAIYGFHILILAYQQDRKRDELHCFLSKAVSTDDSELDDEWSQASDYDDDHVKVETSQARNDENTNDEDLYDDEETSQKSISDPIEEGILLITAYIYLAEGSNTCANPASELEVSLS